MIPAIMDVGAVGSPVDVATFVMVLALLVFRVRPRLQLVAAAVVALARGRDDVDADYLAHRLGVDERAVEMLTPNIIRRGEGDDG